MKSFRLRLVTSEIPWDLTAGIAHPGYSRGMIQLRQHQTFAHSFDDLDNLELGPVGFAITAEPVELAGRFRPCLHRIGVPSGLQRFGYGLAMLEALTFIFGRVPCALWTTTAGRRLAMAFSRAHGAVQWHHPAMPAMLATFMLERTTIGELTWHTNFERGPRSMPNPLLQRLSTGENASPSFPSSLRGMRRSPFRFSIPASLILGH